MTDFHAVLKHVMGDIRLYCRYLSGRRLRSYQAQVAQSIIQSVVEGRGDTIVVMFPRQSGKNELQAQIEAYLLTMFQNFDAEIVKVSPTWKPQTQNAMRRLQRVLDKNLVTAGVYKKEAGYIFRLNNARITFLSGDPEAHVVGATANLLLECDEAQDVQMDKWDRDFAPMAASTNATRVFWGTAWTSNTLLAREFRAALQREGELAASGAPRRLAFRLTADEVRQDVAAYGAFVDEQIRRLGRSHPLVRTQFYSEEIDAESGMFPPERLALMQGVHPCREAPEAGKIYCLLLDVAGEDENRRQDESASLANPRRDATCLTVVEVDLSSLTDELIRAPRYLVVARYQWEGVRHTTLYAEIKALGEHWGARYIVVDATGVGAGLASFLERAFPRRVIPFVFNQKSKSDLGWHFIAAVETGRFKEFAAASPTALMKQAAACRFSVLDGPGKLLRWGAPPGARDPQSGEVIHDDALISAALCCVLDGQEWGIARADVVRGYDPLAELKDAY